MFYMVKHPLTGTLGGKKLNMLDASDHFLKAMVTFYPQMKCLILKHTARG